MRVILKEGQEDPNGLTLILFELQGNSIAMDVSARSLVLTQFFTYSNLRGTHFMRP